MNNGLALNADNYQPTAGSKRTQYDAPLESRKRSKQVHASDSATLAISDGEALNATQVSPSRPSLHCSRMKSNRNLDYRF